jgi:hypothetical protein
MPSEPPDQNETQPEKTTPNTPQQSIIASGGSNIENVSQTIGRASVVEPRHQFRDVGVRSVRENHEYIVTDSPDGETGTTLNERLTQVEPGPTILSKRRPNVRPFAKPFESLKDSCVPGLSFSCMALRLD